jgi:hypothetical protein
VKGILPAKEAPIARTDMTGMDQCVDGVKAFGVKEGDVRKIKAVTRPYSSITLFYDRAGIF